MDASPDGTWNAAFAPAFTNCPVPVAVGGTALPAPAKAGCTALPAPANAGCTALPAPVKMGGGVGTARNSCVVYVLHDGLDCVLDKADALEVMEPLDEVVSEGTGASVLTNEIFFLCTRFSSRPFWPSSPMPPSVSDSRALRTAASVSIRPTFRGRGQGWEM